MTRGIIIAYVYDFLSCLFEKKVPVKRIILFGSMARGDFDGESDIDLFIEPKQESKTKEIEMQIKEIKKEFESVKEHTWKLKRIDYPIREIVGNLDAPVWKTLKQDIISNGIMLYGKYEAPPKEVRHYALVNYSLESMKQKEKMKFLRALQGYSAKKNKKVYAQEGLLQRISGKRLAKNIVLIPLEEMAKIKALLDKFKVNAEIREVWLKNI
ncbi:MAG: nucleotidyltransferase domain-containing protein [Nanoarchaeota archaeon]|nr:nucleotidyltransferase domain-containing protein [Nanoarchaeota archaeon]